MGSRGTGAARFTSSSRATRAKPASTSSLWLTTRRAALASAHTSRMSAMASQSSMTFFENANSQPDFTVVLRGYDRPQVDDFVQRLNAALAQSEAARAEAEQRLAEAVRRAKQAEQALQSAQQKLTDQSKQLEEQGRPTLSGLGTRVEQILRLAEEQANEYRGESKRDSEGIISAARLEARGGPEAIAAELLDGSTIPVIWGG